MLIFGTAKKPLSTVSTLTDGVAYAMRAACHVPKSGEKLSLARLGSETAIRKFLRFYDGKSYVCPVCDNGRGGGKGDGIKPRTNSKGQTRWKCFKCGKDFSNFDLVSSSLGFSEYDTAETAKSLEERMGLKEEAATFSFSRKKCQEVGIGKTRAKNTRLRK